MTHPTMSSDLDHDGRAVTFAANNGDIGGGEVMLLQMARASREKGWRVTIVAPTTDGGVLHHAVGEGFPVVGLAGDRRRYLQELRRWDRSRRGLLWCNGLVPALATTGRRQRVVHLHRLPEGPQRIAARVARRGALLTVVPSSFMTAQIVGAEVMPNWSAEVKAARPSNPDAPLRVGFIGRLGVDKGITVLVDAACHLIDSGLKLRLVVAGESRFVDPSVARDVEQSLALLGPAVERLGWVSPSDFFGRVDVVVVPSIWSEPFGLVVTEAMSARVPVIVSDAGALPEVVGDGYPWIARRGSASDLASVLEACAAASLEDRNGIVARAHERWAEHFSTVAGERRFLALLNSINSRGQA